MDAQNTTPQPEQEILELNLECNPEKKPVKKWPIITAIIIAILAVAAIVAVFIIKALDSKPEEQVITIVDVERQAAGHNLANTFDMEAPVGQSAEISFEINKLALNMIQSQYPELEMLGELNGLTIDSAFERNNGMARFVFDIELDEEVMAPVEIILDSKTNCLYIASELFSDNYLKLDMASFEDEEIDTQMLELLVNAFLDSEMMDRYFNSFLELMTAQETKKEIVTVNGVSQECTVYSAEIDMDSAVQLLIDYLEELKQNNSSASDLFDSAIEKIQESLSENENVPVFYWNVYTDEAGKIIGRDIGNEDEKFLNYLVTTDGEDIGVTFSVGALEMSGNAVLQDGLLDGTFIIREDAVDYLKISTDGFDVEGCKNGLLNGIIEIEPTDELMALLFDEKIRIPVSITTYFESTQDEQNVSVSLMEMATISIKLTQYTPDTISLPDGNEIDGEDVDAFSELFGGIVTGDSV